MSTVYDKLVYLKELENTRMVYDFMSELDLKINSYKAYNGNGGLKKRRENREHLKKTVEAIISNSVDESEVLYQNPLSGYLRFWKKYYDAPNYNSVYIDIANAYAVYKAAMSIEGIGSDKISEDDLPYMYEDLCISAAELLGCEMCYVIYKGDDDEIQIVARSGYHVYNESIMPDPPFADIIKLYVSSNMIIKGINLVCGDELANVDDTDLTVKYDYLVYDFPFYIGEKSKDDKSSAKKFFIIFCKQKENGAFGDKPKETVIMEKSKKILFLRHKIISILGRDYGLLLNYRFDCHYIKRIHDTSEKLRIFHISDIHAEDDKAWEKGSYKFNEADRLLGSLLSNMGSIGENPSSRVASRDPEENRRSIELMAITGDIIQADKSAHIVQRKYSHAAGIIKYIAAKLWREKDSDHGIFRLPHDWKRRVIITTGNHDYMTMNELVAQTKERQTRYGEPSQTGGGTMTKFTYYIEFLQKFIDAPIDKLLRYDLNEVRYYRNFDLKVLVLNTVSVANALQNNKIGVNIDIVNSLLSSALWSDSVGKLRLCLLHHGPMYEPNYIDDIYRDRGLFSKTKSESKDHHVKLSTLYLSFKGLVENLLDKDEKVDKYESFLKDYKTMSDYIDERKAAGDETDEERAWIKQYYNSSIYPVMRDLYDYIRKTHPYSLRTEDKDEFIAQIISKLENNAHMGISDKKKHDNMIDSVKNAAEEYKMIFISGHVHKSNDYSDVTSGDILNFVAGKALNEMTVIELDTSGSGEWNRWKAK